MTRPPRALAAGLTYHVTTRGNARQLAFRDDADRRTFLGRLAAVVCERGWRVESYCLMPNHVHLLVKTPRPDLSAGMQDLLGRHARAFNDRHRRTGHVFQARFHTRVVTRDAHHLELFRYLALNPVRSGLCSAPAAFPWSAHAALLGRAAAQPFLDSALRPFGGDRAAYARFVAAGTPAGSYLTDLLGGGGVERMRAAAEAGFSQAAIGAALGMDQTTVGRRIRGATPRRRANA